MEGVRWARPYRSDTQQGPTPRKVTDVLQTGQQIWVRQVDDAWWLAQVPEVNSALVSINPQNGAVMALVGGFDFNQSKFNRATQALRQVGSNIKPFLYTAAMDKGLTLASMLNDVPISRWDAGAGSDWQPKNSPPQYAGPIRLRQGLGQSKNVVMVRLRKQCGRWASTTLQNICNASASRHKTLSTPNRWRWVQLPSPQCRWRAATRSWRTAASWWTRGLSAKLKTIRAA
ncbi:hypothetical protein EIMP300_16460 [Escherichia coli]|uniref:Penicillin-binding protein 1A n=1 Tax=Escherichia coli TaxID=562 RepID=A0A8S0FGX0_ECOLX|nr:hypothetical protein EIMP300_16460 [Escherichia coli]